MALEGYEQEADLFFRDLSSAIITDDVFQRLLSFPSARNGKSFAFPNKPRRPTNRQDGE